MNNFPLDRCIFFYEKYESTPIVTGMIFLWNFVKFSKKFTWETGRNGRFIRSIMQNWASWTERDIENAAMPIGIISHKWVTSPIKLDSKRVILIGNLHVCSLLFVFNRIFIRPIHNSEKNFWFHCGYKMRRWIELNVERNSKCSSHKNFEFEMKI